MKHHNTVFYQCLRFLPRHKFQKVVDRQQWKLQNTKPALLDTMLAMMFAQLTGRAFHQAQPPLSPVLSNIVLNI